MWRGIKIMLISEVKAIASNFLKGDNSNADIADSVVLLAVKEIAMRCEPLKLLGVFDETKTDVFRMVVGDTDTQYYIKVPTIENGNIELDEDLILAVVFFVCSYYSFKNKDYFERKAEFVISMSKTNSINVV